MVDKRGKNGTLNSYTYDGNNLRISKTSGGTTTEFLYDGANIVDEKTYVLRKNYVGKSDFLLPHINYAKKSQYDGVCGDFI